MTDFTLTNLRLVATMDDEGTELRDTSMTVRDGWITSIGTDEPAAPAEDHIDGRRLIALPGFVNAHHHLFQTLTRGFPQAVGRTLFPWLEMLYPIWSHLDEDMIYASTRTGLAELVRSGCTTSSDHLYVFPRGSDGFVNAQVEAARSLHMRFHVTRGSMDLGASHGGLPPDSVVQSLGKILDESVTAIESYHDSSPGAMTQVALAPCSPFSVTQDLMRESAALARASGVRLHTHIAETMDEDMYSRSTYGMSPVELLQSVGWSEDDVWAAHCVHPGPSDIDILAKGSVAVAHCPTSNMLLGSGLAPVRTYLDRGIAVGLGVDGSASNDANDLRQEVKQALLVARTRDGVSALTAREALRLATRGGAACLGRDDIGSLQPGKAADIVLYDADDIALAGCEEDLLAGIVLSVPQPVHVIVQGEFVVRDGKLVNADLYDIAREHRVASSRLLEKAGIL